MLDEAQLWSLEWNAQHAAEATPDDLLEVIDSLRQAWRERDETRQHEQNCAELLRIATDEAIRYKRERDYKDEAWQAERERRVALEDAHERANRAEAVLAGTKAQALEWKQTLDDVTSREWHQRQHDIEAELHKLRAVRVKAAQLVEWAETHTVLAYPLIERLRNSLDACKRWPMEGGR